MVSHAWTWLSLMYCPAVLEAVQLHCVLHVWKGHIQRMSQPASQGIAQSAYEKTAYLSLYMVYIHLYYLRAWCGCPYPSSRWKSTLQSLLSLSTVQIFWAAVPHCAKWASWDLFVWPPISHSGQWFTSTHLKLLKWRFTSQEKQGAESYHSGELLYVFHSPAILGLCYTAGYCTLVWAKTGTLLCSGATVQSELLSSTACI